MSLLEPNSDSSTPHPVVDSLGGFRRERLLLLGLSASSIVTSVYLVVFHLNPAAGEEPTALIPVCTILTFVTALLAIEVYRSMNRKLVDLHGLHVQAERQNSCDPLTGALTRRWFLEAYDRALARHRNRGSVALILIDIDHFKQINDSLGHPAGDRVLEFCARAARSAFHDSTVGRIGGDEFAIFVAHEEAIGEAYLAKACDTMLSELREGLHIGNRRVGLTASMGIALSPRDDDNLRVLMSYADIALYHSKRSGRARWTVFSNEMLGDQRFERFLERELRAAILLRQISVQYQPIVDANGALHSLEALARWDHPVRGMIDPATFIPVAEKTNLIHDLGLSVLTRVCEDMEILPEVPINVNVSARQFRLGEFQRDYLGVLKEHAVGTGRIVLEITESASLDLSPALLKRLEDLRAAGLGIALDDFGLGYSEFNHLRELSFDTIKIDKSFIQAIGLDRVTDVFVNAVVQVARHLDRKVVAEGIETTEDHVRAKAAGCQLFQGYHIMRPSTPEAVFAAYCSPESRVCA